ncbi:uncharacterized protein [Antedon mediterranea]|uniref:uncharacterized protein n=1 Tax=Antedon mediterranea TaxID=105859 RepID=UPI003AF7FC4F
MQIEKICDDYFSSISSLAQNIVTEKREKIEEYGYDRWERLNQDEKDERLNDWFIDPKLALKYQIQLGGGGSDDRPDDVLKWQVKTGQKMVHHTDHDGSQSKGTMLTWRDEFSAPFTWETPCQQKIPLPNKENMETTLPRENELLDSGWKEETTIDGGLEDSILTDFSKDLTVTTTSASSANDWTNTSSCSRENLIDESRNVAPSAYRARSVQEHLKLDLQSSSSTPSDRKQRSPKREKKSPKSSKKGRKGSTSPKRESSKIKVQPQKKDSPPSPLSIDFPSVTDSLLPKKASPYHGNQTWNEEPKMRVVTQQPTSWNENPTFQGNARTNGVTSEMNTPAARGPAPQNLPVAEPAAELDMAEFTFDSSPQDDKPLKFTDFEDNPANVPAEASGDAYNFLLDW